MTPAEIKELLLIAHSANPADRAYDDWGNPSWGDSEYEAKDGWRVTFSYDGGELDYIHHFTKPDGEIIDPFKIDDDTVGLDLLINWRGTDDTERLLAALAEDEK